MALTGDTFDFQQGNVVTSSAQIVDNGAAVGDVLTVQADKSIAAAPGGGSQPFVRITLRHSADFTNISGSAPVVAAGVVTGALTLPPSAFGNDSIIDVKVYNDTAADVKIGGGLVVQNADGTVWIGQDISADQTIAAGANASLDFSADDGSGGAGLSWNSETKQVDIASAGVYSAFATLYALPA